jgi:hypothetical protein
LNTIAIGNSAQFDGLQSSHSIGIGTSAGSNDQGPNSIAIGRSAGATDHGASSVAVGHNARLDNADNSIVLNSSGLSTVSTDTVGAPGTGCCIISTQNPRILPNTYVDNSFHVDCIREGENMPNFIMSYDKAKREVKFVPRSLISNTRVTSGVVTTVNGFNIPYYSDLYVILFWRNVSGEDQPIWEYDDTDFPLPGGSGDFDIYTSIAKYGGGGLDILRSSRIGNTNTIASGSQNFHNPTNVYDSSYDWVNDDTHYVISLRFIGDNGNTLQYRMTLCGNSPGTLGFAVTRIVSGEF